MGKYPDSSPLLTTSTKGAFAFLRLLFLLVACAGLGIQLVLLTQGSTLREAYGWTYYAPIGAALVCFVCFLRISKGGGEIRIFRDRLEGRRSMGVPFQLPMDSIAEIKLDGKRLALMGKDNELLLIETTLHPMAGGLIWLCKNYGHWEEAVWQSFSPNVEDGFQRATRYFLGEDGKPSFGDNGFLVPFAGHWYFPETAMFPILGREGQPKRIHYRSDSHGATLFQLDPSPDNLPLAALCGALLEANLITATLGLYFEELGENHGGNRCEAMPGDAQWTGECMGYAVRVDVKG